MRILLVEDDASLGESLCKGLRYNGDSVEWVTRGEDALSLAFSGDFDVAILDIGLPDGSGIDVLRRIRQHKDAGQLPVLLLTALDRIEQKVSGLDAGADDYLTKPFDLQELLARLRVLTRRSLGMRDNSLSTSRMQLDLASHLLTMAEGGQAYVLTANEFRLLSLLMRRPGQLISKARIEEELHGWEGEAESNTVEVTIYNLRKKLGKEAIVNMRGVGYMVMA